MAIHDNVTQTIRPPLPLTFHPLSPALSPSPTSPLSPLTSGGPQQGEGRDWPGGEGHQGHQGGGRAREH